MPATAYIDHLRTTKGQLPPTDALARIVTELLAVHATGRITYVASMGGANAAPIYKQNNGNWETWGAYVCFKTGSLPSFVHELTHASCCLVYKANMLNYTPPNPATLAMTISNGPIVPAAPADSRFCTNEVARRLNQRDDQVAPFLTTNLDRLEAWADVTDFSSVNPWLDKRTVQEMQTLEKLVAKNKATAAQILRLQALREDTANYGVMAAPKKKSQQALMLQQESTRKRDYIKERINYGKVGMGGQGDVHFEYDTVINQMLYQMYMWGLRPSAPWNPPMLILAEQAHQGKVPAAYFYGRLEALAFDAFTRRAAAARIAHNANPVITSPPVMINPPPQVN